MASTKHQPHRITAHDRKPQLQIAQFFITFNARKDEAHLDVDFNERLYEDRNLAMSLSEDMRDLLDRFEKTYEKHYRSKEVEWWPIVKEASAKNLSTKGKDRK